MVNYQIYPMYYIIPNLSNQINKFIIRPKYELLVPPNLINIYNMYNNKNAVDYLKKYFKISEINEQFVLEHFRIAQLPNMI